ncbi:MULTISPECIES: DNA polymerase Y family protein [unclassified Roseateles]|uniref:Y-family DNA polymerase n=1 Tax=unclassified Roseateles TaxID=2626991 RepID=UPI001F2EE3F0|nr:MULTISPECIES: DNA polymerase Y family protein [unclassified Roseateles]
MKLWVALTTSFPPVPPASPKKPSHELPQPTVDALQRIAMWALQFTPRVATVEGCAVVLEVWASLRLFKGAEALKARVADEAPDLGVTGIGWAPTALGSLALARCDEELDDRAMETVLDALPLLALNAASLQVETLARAGINTLGQLRRLPRPATSRRFGEDLLVALDQTYGLRPETFEWETIPEEFQARFELPAREENAPALMAYARPMLLQMCGWLAARHTGAEGFRLTWVHDSMRAKDAGPSGDLVIRSSSPMRDANHFTKLLSEHLAKVELLAPVGELKLEAVGVERVTEESLSLFPQTTNAGEALTLALERVASRLGAKRVLQPYEVDEHRAEWTTLWSPVAKRKNRKQGDVEPLPAPTFLLERPLKLTVRNERPFYQGRLIPIVGPERVEGGWWNRLPGASLATQHAEREYWTVQSEIAGTLWIFSTREETGEPAWYLHGMFS